MVGLMLAVVASVSAEPKVPTIWCCINGNIVNTTPAACEHKGGTAFPSKASAIAACEKTWCCHKTPKGWQVDYMPASDCKKMGGICYGSKDEAAVKCGKKK
ncbi:MAG: hypothetical protein QOH88_2208 [Verrucomicrobiota bacterium]